jgi:hypothetical protein
MKRFIPGTALALAVLAGNLGAVHATEVGTSRRLGLGVQIIDPIAIIGKMFIGGGNAIDAGLGFGSVGYVRCRDAVGVYAYCGDNVGRLFSIHGDYLWQDNLVREGNLKLDWHIGAGGRIIFDNVSNRGFALIARMPIGLDFTFNRPGFLELFVEIAPGLVIVPPLFFDIDAALGVRLYF